MRLGNPTRLEERSGGIKLYTVCMYGHGLAATALLQNLRVSRVGWAPSPRPGRRRRPAAGQKPLDAAHEGVQRRAGVTLPEVGGREASNEAVDAETAHGLVTETQARRGVAAHY